MWVPAWVGWGWPEPQMTPPPRPRGGRLGCLGTPGSAGRHVCSAFVARPFSNGPGGGGGDLFGLLSVPGGSVRTDSPHALRRWRNGGGR